MIQLGEWTNWPRRSRRMSGLDPVESCSDVNPVLNHRTVEKDFPLLHAKIGNDACDLSRLNRLRKKKF